jgi:TPR repeat protein
MKRAFLLVALLCSLSWSACARDDSKGMDAFMRGDEVEAVREWHRAAERGGRDSMEMLGVMYSAGIGVPQDYVEAYIWYSLSTALGNEDARTRRDEMAGKLPPDQLRGAQLEAGKRWKRLQARKK